MSSEEQTDFGESAGPMQVGSDSIESGQPQDIAGRLIAWYAQHGRHALPWQNTRDAYRIWLSEIMLQQTQVATVIPYFNRFLNRFPTIDDLARAPVEEVMSLWSGLGYYARARNLHRCAQILAAEHGGRFPPTAEEIATLPGIGRSTAAAIAAFAYGERAAILDGNVKRVLTRCFGIEGFPGERRIEDRLWQLARSLLPERGIESYTQALMDLGATLCTRGKPACLQCPVSQQCIALATGRVAALPTPRPKKKIAQRSQRYLILQRGTSVLLERRPPLGIWGGLLCLPELGAEQDVVFLARERYGCHVGKMQSLPSIAHTFTHFGLDIQPILCEVIEQSPQVAQADAAWYCFDALAQAALPAPLRRLLEMLATSNPADSLDYQL